MPDNIDLLMVDEPRITSYRQAIFLTTDYADFHRLGEQTALSGFLYHSGYGGVSGL